MAERVRVREIANEEGQRLLRIVRRSSGSVVTWRRAQVVLLSAQAMEVDRRPEATSQRLSQRAAIPLIGELSRTLETLPKNVASKAKAPPSAPAIQ